MNITPTFTVGSGIGRSKNTTPSSLSSSSSYKSPARSLSQSSASAQVQERNKQLIHMKEQFLSLKQQFKEEQMQDNEKIMILERQLRQEIKKTQELEEELTELKNRNIGKTITGSARVVENIWNIMTSYREQIRNGALEQKETKQENRQNDYRRKVTVNYDNDEDSDMEYSILHKRVSFK